MGRNTSASNGYQHTNAGGVWRLAWRGLRVTRTIALVLLLAASLSANAALFIGGVLHNVIDEAFESVTGLATETGRQRVMTDGLKQKNRQLDDRNRNLQKRMTEVQRENGRLKGRMTRLRKATSRAVNGTLARTVNAVARAVATAPAKAIPYAGTAVVAGALVLEIRDLCDTIRDVKEIQREIDPSETNAEDRPEVCGMDKEEILNQITMAPLDAWERSRGFLADLDPMSPEREAELHQWWNDSKGLFQDGLDSLDWMLSGSDAVNDD